MVKYKQLNRMVKYEKATFPAYGEHTKIEVHPNKLARELLNPDSELWRLTDFSQLEPRCYFYNDVVRFCPL